MYPNGEADGQLVNIPALTYTAMEGRRSERSAPQRMLALKPVDISLVGKSARDVEGDSTTSLRMSG